MANHKSAIKRIRANEKKRVDNKYYHKTTRNAIKKIKETEDASAYGKDLPTVISMIDKLAKKNVIHKNKAANLKSKLMKKLAVIKEAKPVAKTTKTTKAKATKTK